MQLPINFEKTVGSNFTFVNTILEVQKLIRVKVPQESDIGRLLFLIANVHIVKLIRQSVF